MSDILIKIVTAVCFAALSIEAIRGFINIVFRGRMQRIRFLRGFKKGRFAVIYAAALPLYCLGHMYAGQNLIKAFFNTIPKIIELVVLKYDFDSIELLLDNDLFYRITVYFCFVMAGLNVVLVTVSFINQRVWEFWQEAKIKYCLKDRLLVFGNNSQNIDVYESDKSRRKAIIDKISDDDRSNFYLKKISDIPVWSDEEATEEIFRERRIVSFLKKLKAFAAKSTRETENIVIINTESDERNMRICRMIIEKISAKTEEEKERIFKTVKVFTFGDLKYQGIYEDIESDGFGCITFINKHKKIGADFIERYPLAYFMDEKQIDYKTSLIKKDVNINFFMLSFDKVGRQIFLTSVSNNQFLTEGENGPELKKVNYYIFDKENAQKDKNLNHNYYRYRNEITDDKECNAEEYLPLPSLPAAEPFCPFDVNDERFYKELKKYVEDENDANFVLINFGTDLENIDMAQKLVEKRREWGKNLVIFVRTHNRTKEQEALEAEGCIFIGNEKEIVYNIDRILSDEIHKIAIMRNEDYDLEYATSKPDIEITDEFIAEKKYESFKKWHTKMHRFVRESNIYAAMSIKAKLNLMGLDYCKEDANDEPELKEEEYLEIYAAGDMPRYIGETPVGKRKLVGYDLNFADSRRRNMAILEHYRWNSYLISKGFVPATKEQILNEKEDGRFTNGKNYALRRHGNLTTFDGLIEFRKLVAERDGVSEAEKDVIKYDYQILDDLHYFLTQSGYKIIRKK